MKNTATFFYEQSLRRPEALALNVEATDYTFREVNTMVAMLASKMALRPSSSDRLHVAIFTGRSLSAYIGVLATMYTGRAYIPLNPRFPDARNLYLLEAISAEIIIVDEKCSELLKNFVTEISGKLILMLEHETTPEWCKEHPQNEYYALDRLKAGAPTNFEPVPVNEQTAAYTLFTSGTTGLPKGVTITHSNLQAFITNYNELYEMNENDRATMMFDLTFDASVLSIWPTWVKGAALFIVPENLALFGVRYVRENQISHWGSVPSTGAILNHHGFLEANCMPSLRYTWFGGEALPASLCRAWTDAAPNSEIVNIYGPTEATVCFTHLLFDKNETYPTEILPIGKAFTGQKTVLVDTSLKVLGDGDSGELLVSGSQVSAGYLKAPELTADKYVKLQGQGSDEIWYRTGDIAKWGAKFGYEYIGRIDNQVKLRGFRVDLSEIENAIFKISSCSMVAVIGNNAEHTGGYSDVVAFVAGSTKAAQEIIDGCRKLIPEYMIPSQVILKSVLPLTPNGKTDVKALRAELLAKA